MSDEFVNRQEFENLKEEVRELKEEVNEYKQLLHQIDKKIDVITERISKADEMDEIKLRPFDDRIKKLEENQSWLWKLCGTIIVTGIIGAIVKFK